MDNYQAYWQANQKKLNEPQEPIKPTENATNNEQYTKAKDR